MDTVIENANPFGKYQKLILSVIGIPCSLAAILTYSTIFTTANPKFFCEYFNDTTKPAIIIEDSKKVCDIWSNMDSEQNYTCKFDNKYYGKTIVTDWSLICHKKVLANLTQTFFMLGSFFAIFCGYFGDRYGRKKSAIGFQCLLTVTLLVTQILLLDFLSISTTAKYVIYCVSQLIIGLCISCIFMSSYVLLLELTIDKYHTIFSNLKLVFYIVGELLILLVAYLVRDFKIINWAITAMAVISTITTFILIDESPRWYVSQGRYDEAFLIMKKISRINRANQDINLKSFDKKITDEDSFYRVFNVEKNADDENDDENGQLTSVKDMLRQIFTPKKMFLRTALTAYVWLASSLLYYGISLGVNDIDSINPYILYIFSSFAELIGIWLCLINNKFGHRKMNIVYLMISTLVCLAIGLIPRNKDLNNHVKVLQDAILVISLISIAKCTISAAFNTIYVHTVEIYPTNVRNFALLFCSSVGEFGSIISPQINLLGDLVWKAMPFFIFSGSAFISLIFVFILPESDHQFSFNRL